MAGFRMEARRMISEMNEMDTDWRDRRYLDMLGYAILAGYQLALWRALGSGSGAMTQMLLGEVGDLVLEALRETGVNIDYDVAEPDKIVEDVLGRIGIAREVRVERLEDSVKHGRRLRRYRVVIKDSMFAPVHAMLVQRGMREYPLSPEALVIAAIVRRVLHSRNPRARVSVRAILPASGNEPLEVIVEEVAPLTN